MNDRLKILTERGHGHCLEAILLEPDIEKRIQKLERYVEKHAQHDTQTIRKARHALGKLRTEKAIRRREQSKQP